MNEFDLLGPTAYGERLGTAVLKATAEDFQVDEVLDIPLSGDGEHLWLWVEKRGLNTEEAARRIAKAAGVPLRTYGELCRLERSSGADPTMVQRATAGQGRPRPVGCRK